MSLVFFYIVDFIHAFESKLIALHSTHERLETWQLLLRWLVTVSSTFQGSLYIYNHSIPVDAKIMVSTNCPIIGEQVAVSFVAK